MKKIVIEIVYGEKEEKKGLFIGQKNFGDWSLIEELGVMEALVQQTYNKMNIKFQGGKKPNDDL